jgi:hypothetical protein
MFDWSSGNSINPGKVPPVGAADHGRSQWPGPLGYSEPVAEVLSLCTISHPQFGHTTGVSRRSRPALRLRR